MKVIYDPQTNLKGFLWEGVARFGFCAIMCGIVLLFEFDELAFAIFKILGGATILLAIAALLIRPKQTNERPKNTPTTH